MNKRVALWVLPGTTHQTGAPLARISGVLVAGSVPEGVKGCVEKRCDETHFSRKLGMQLN